MSSSGDDVLSMSAKDSDSEFSGFGSEDLVQPPEVAEHIEVRSEDVISPKKKKGKSPVKGKKKTKTSAPKPKVKSSKNKAKSSKTGLNLQNLSGSDLKILKEKLGLNSKENWHPEILSEDDYDQYLHRGSFASYESEREDFNNPNVPGTSKTSSNLVKNLENELFRNESDSENEEWGPPRLKVNEKDKPISSSLANLINVACTSQCDIDKLLDKHKIPENVEKACPPLVNAEIWKILDRRVHSQDKFISDVQNVVATAMVPIIKLATSLKKSSCPESRTHVSEALTLMGQAQYHLSVRRRYNIRPHLKKKYHSLCNISMPITTNLFGDDVAKDIKACESISNVGRETYQTRSGWRGRGRSSRRGGYNSSNYGNQQYSGGYGNRQIVDKEVRNLLEMGAISPCERENNDYLSTIFIVPKPNGKFRPVINLRFLNKYVHYDHFKQETFKVVLDLLQQGDFMTSVDMEQAYFAIPIHEDFQKFLKFSWNGTLYKFTCLCFGLKSAPFVFTKVLKPIFSWFRQQGIRCSYYIDDSLNMNSSMVVCKFNTDMITSTLQSLGFTINYKKSVLVPTQRIVFFGFLIDSVEFKIYLTEEKIQKILLKINSILKSKRIIIRDLASCIGSIVSTFHAILEAPLHYRSLERDKIFGLGLDMDFERKIVLSKQSCGDLNWWVENLRPKNGKKVRPDPVAHSCRSDASLQGWGAIELSCDTHANGRWSIAEAKNSINYLELLAIFYALQSFYFKHSNVHIQVESDNVSAITYINDMGGMTSMVMDSLAKDIWDWCVDREIFVTAVHVPGIENTADYFSRNFSDSTEWMLKDDVFKRICLQLFEPDIDLFASRLNTRLSRFVSWFSEPGAFFCNAFSKSWTNFIPYIFAPFSLIGRVINKIKEDSVEKAILVFPLWKSQSWFPMLTNVLVDIPIRLPRHKDLMILPHNKQLHPLAKKITMVAATVSGQHSGIRDFRQRLQQLSSIPGDHLHTNSTTWHGGNGFFGAIDGIQIPFQQLK